jgi:hypothetical protein
MTVTVLLERAIEKVEALTIEEQDAIASQILDTISDEEAWRHRFEDGRKLERLAEAARNEFARGETRPLEELL